MAKIARKTALPFGSTASAGQIGEFGSFAATGTGVYSTDPAVIQSLSQWLSGWYSAVVSGNSPPLQDMNGFCFVVMYLLCYIQKAGIQEWDAGTTYYKGSLCNSAGVIYVSLTDTNLNNAVTSTTNWKLQYSGIRTTTGNDTILQTDDFIRGNATSGSFTETLPAVASTPIGKEYTIKNVSTLTSVNTVTVAGNGSENIDGANTLVLSAVATLESVTVCNNGTSWDII